MNMRRGLFRVWLVGSVLFIAAVAWHFAAEIRNDLVSVALQEQMRAGGIRLVPAACSNARGVAGADYRTGIAEQRWPWEDYGADPAPRCWYEMAKFHALYPEYADLTDDLVAKRLYERANFKMIDAAVQRRKLGWLVALAAGVPLAALVVGAALYWALAGFRRELPRQRTVASRKAVVRRSDIAIAQPGFLPDED